MDKFDEQLNTFFSKFYTNEEIRDLVRFLEYNSYDAFHKALKDKFLFASPACAFDYKSLKWFLNACLKDLKKDIELGLFVPECYSSM